MLPSGSAKKRTPTPPDVPFLLIRDALRQGAEMFEQAGVAVPRLTAEVLLSHALHRDRAFLFAHPEQELREVEWIHYGRDLSERLAGKPMQYITGHQEFYGRDFRVTTDVLIPRPETEHLVETALANGARRVLDVGTGSGCIAITLALLSRARVTASDISAPALSLARENARHLGAAIGLVLADCLDAFAPRSFDLVVSNPPYIPAAEHATLSREVRDFEPALALTPGPTGLEIYARLIGDAARVLTPGGSIALELGHDSASSVTAMLAEAGFESIAVTPDLAGIPRVASAKSRTASRTASLSRD